MGCDRRLFLSAAGALGLIGTSALAQESKPEAKPAEAANGAFFVPHNLAAPVTGSGTGPLTGLTAGVKDMYDIAGSRTGAGNPSSSLSTPLSKPIPESSRQPKAFSLAPRAEESAVAPDGIDAWRDAFRIVQAREVWESYGDFVRSANPEFGQQVGESPAAVETLYPSAGSRPRGPFRRPGEVKAIIFPTIAPQSPPCSPTAISCLGAFRPPALAMRGETVPPSLAALGLLMIPSATFPEFYGTHVRKPMKEPYPIPEGFRAPRNAQSGGRAARQSR